MTSFLVFAALKDIAGYRPEVFYVFSIFLHFINCLLLRTLISRLWGNIRIAYLAAVLFAVVQAPQEAILWLAAMGEPLVAFCLLSAILLWLKDRYILSALMFGFGLFSKESGVILLVLLPLIQWQRGKPLFPKRYFLFLIPTAVFGGVFLWTWSKNSYIQGGIYDAGPHAALVFVKTLNRLLWPWFYSLLVAFRIDTGRWPDWRRALPYLPWLGAAMAPYLFLTYQGALPSRHVYLISMVLDAGTAFLIYNLRSVRLQQTFVAAFLSFNVGYLWIRKDAQFEGRAKPTTELLRLLRSHAPTPVMVYDFPYTETMLARDVAPLAPGWTPALIEVHSTTETCLDCVSLRWDPKSGTYIGPW
ncbi:MAG TPA: hypothetical protein VGK48_26105 [Terriglobia bacterium]